MRTSTLAGYNEQLPPKLTERPQTMLNEAAEPGSTDPTPEEWEEAGKKLNWASDIKNGDTVLTARALYCTGRAAFLNKQEDAALTAWRRATDMDKSWALPANGVGLLYNIRKDYASARPYLLEAIRRQPGWAFPYNNLGTSYYYERNYDQAEEYYNQAVSRSTHWARPHAWLGDIAMHKKDYNRAITEFESVLAVDAVGTSSIDLNIIRARLEQAQKAAASP